ncbi:pyocin knob domain-containing protein [Limosilactobacillus reuteri]|uniref:pyocin knob domain-containing protein n=1 Tax=Limosilactobacillus reuteri TaxID=1598 RepID=UPI003D002A50
MAENSRLSDETKNNSTDTSSTDASSAVIGNHENAIVPHKISNHDKLVQTMVMVDGEWINVNDTNDQANMKEDMHKVNKKVVEAQKGIVEAKNTADSAVKYADSAVSASKVNSDALVAQSSAISEAKAAADDAASKAQFIKENASSEAAVIRNQVADVANNVSSVKADVASAASDVANLKVDVQTNSAAIIKTNEAVSVQSKSSSDAINELKIANGQVESIAKDAKNNATVAKQAADAATIVAQDAKSNAVVAKQTASSATIEATNATSTASKAELSVDGLTTRVNGIEGDTKNLSGRVASTETILQQTKDQLLQKADKSVVDQANNLISQLSAEQKTMAGQISQKVSSSEYQTLKDKVNNLRIGGRNLIPNSGTDIVIESKTTDPYPAWDNKAIYWNLTPGETYTFSVSATNTNGVEQASVRIFKESLDGKYLNKEAAHWYFNADGKRHNFTFTTPNDAIPYDIWLYAGPMGTLQGKNFVTTYHHPQLELGNIESDYSPNPDDTITSIQKNITAIDENSKAIKLKADATEVNNLKGTVNSHSASINLFSDQLKSMVTESKVNDIINGKGFATQSYTQSIVNQKADQWNTTIAGLTQQLNNSSDVNLAEKTNQGTTNWTVDPGNGASTISEVNINGIRGVRFTQTRKSTSWWVIAYQLNLNYFEPNQDYIISFDIRTSSDNFSQGGMLNIARGDSSHAYLANTSFRTNFKKNQLTHVSCTGHSYGSLDKSGETFYLNSLGLGQCDWVDVVNLKIARGTIDKGYSPAPSDTATTTQLTTMQASIDGLQGIVKNKVDQSQYTQLAGVVQTKVSQSDFNRLNNQVNVQTLDSANIDNMKTTGHYFVRNLTGNPIGGWVYVDVTGNANDRIRQDVYQDSGTKHAFRRWFGSYWTGWSTGAEESEITQLRSDINLRVKSGDLLSQINIAAGHTLIQSNKIYFDADSFVMSPNSKAFIPSAYITNINADKITTGTLDAAKFNVRNFSANNITGGTLSGVVVKTGANDRYFQTSKDNIYWVRNGSMSLIGNDTYLNSANGLNIADENNIQLTTWGGATVNKDGSITNLSGNSGHPKIIIDPKGKYNPDDIYGSAFGGGPGNSEIAQWVGNKEYTVLTRGKGFTVHLNDGNNNSKFSIQKDNKVGFYVGGGNDGNEIQIAGFGPIKLQGRYIDDGFDDGMTHTFGNVQVDNLHVRKWLGVDQSKNAIVKTSQGPVTINAYETAEYYFGDIGEGQTSTDGIAYIGIEKLFNETVNTTIPYHVFITAYGPGNIWVDQREHNRFIVKSDQPNLKFSWEIKAKRKGYEHTRLQNVDDKLNHMAVTS